jgi:hypothetical protein
MEHTRHLTMSTNELTMSVFAVVKFARIAYVTAVVHLTQVYCSRECFHRSAVESSTEREKIMM